MMTAMTNLKNGVYLDLVFNGWIKGKDVSNDVRDGSITGATG